MRQDGDQAVRVAGLRGQHDAAPEAVHPDRADPVVPAVLQLLQVQPGVSVLGELADRRLDRALYAFLQFCVFREEAFRDRQARQCLPPSASRCLYPRLSVDHVRPLRARGDSW